MTLENSSLKIKAYGPANLFDLTGETLAFLAGQPASRGRVFIFSIGSTGAIVGLPASDAAFSSFVDWAGKTIPFDSDHRHPGNAFAHLRSTILKSGISMPVQNKRILGDFKPQLLENTAGRKNRPIDLTWVCDGGEMAFFRSEFKVDCEGWIDMVDITGRVMDVVASAGAGDGEVFVSALDERSAIITIENEMRLVLDTADFINRLTRRDGEISRSLAGHIGSALLGQSVAFPLMSGRLDLGTWQQIMLVDLAESGAKSIIVDVIYSSKDSV